MKNLVFPRIFLHCVALGFIVSGLLLSTSCGFDSRWEHSSLVARANKEVPACDEEAQRSLSYAWLIIKENI